MTKDFHKLFITMRSDSTRRLDAWKLFITLNPKNFYIRNVLQSISELRVIAWEELELRKPNKSDLRFIIKNIPELSKEAGEYFLASPLRIDDFICIFSSLPELIPSYTNIIREYLQKMSPKDLRKVLRWIPELRGVAGELLLNSRKVMREDLRRIIRYVPSMKFMAVDKLLRMNPNKVDLSYIDRFSSKI